jgi:AAA+ ATPase superfamily predicted ATPase
MRIIIGNPARDEDFLPRRDEMKKILDAINSLQNFQISAPRRIGKTSLLYYYYDNPPPDCIVIFVDTESVNSVNGFYKKLCQKILENENISEKKSLIDQLSQSTNRFLKKIKGFQILGNTIELKDDNDVDYLEELTNFLKELI